MLLPNPVPSHPIPPNSVPSHLTYSTTILYPSKDGVFGIGIGIVKKGICGTEVALLLPNPVPSHPTYSTTIQYPSKDFGFGIGIGIVKKGI